MKRAIPLLVAKFTLLIIACEFGIMFFLDTVLPRDIPGHNFISAVLDAIILGLIVMFVLKGVFSKSLQKIIWVMDEAGKGNLGVNLKIRRPLEMKLIGDKINKTLTSLKNYYDKSESTTKLLTAITDGVDEAIMLIDLNFRIIWANKKIISLSRLKIGDVLGSFCYKITHHLDEPCKPPKDICPIEEVVKKGIPLSVIHTHYDKEGNELYEEVAAYPVKNEKGEVVQFIHIARDITEKVRMLEELKVARDKLKEYADSLEVMVERKTRDLTLSMQRSDEQRKAILNILEDAEDARREMQVLNEELKDAEAQVVQSAKMAAVGQLASGVAHEINNPLAGILNCALLMRMQIERNKDYNNCVEFKETISDIEQSALRCKKITRSLLDFSHASAGEFQDNSLNEIVEKTVFLVEYEMSLQNVKIQLDLEPQMPFIKCDSQLMQQVILNIITNAAWAIQKKADQSGGVVALRTRHEPEAGRVCLYICDNGIGIPSEIRDKLFEPFFTTKPVGEGTGLGLSLVYNIIKDHKGSIELEGEVGKGTTFRIYLPTSK